jgi:putative hydrolase
MTIYGDLHTHTVFSHGKGTMEENVLAALDRGLSAVAVTDHGLSHFAYGISKRELNDYLAEVDRLREKYAGRIRVLSGVEANIIGPNGEIDVPDWLDKRLDIVLMGFHRAARNANWINWFQFIIANGKAFTDAGKRRQQDRNTKAFIRAIENHRVDAITHPQYIARVHVAELAEACARTGTLLEINNKHGDITPEELQTALSAGADFLVSSDAHHPSAVGVVDRALARAEAAGIPPERVFNSTNYRGGKGLPVQ